MMRQHHWYHSDHPMLGKNQHPMSMEHLQLDIPGSKIIMLRILKSRSKSKISGATEMYISEGPFLVMVSVAKGFRQKLEIGLPVYIFRWKSVYLCSFISLKRWSKNNFGLAPPSGQNFRNLISDLIYARDYKLMETNILEYSGTNSLRNDDVTTSGFHKKI